MQPSDLPSEEGLIEARRIRAWRPQNAGAEMKSSREGAGGAAALRASGHLDASLVPWAQIARNAGFMRLFTAHTS